ncbi:hypothetical protein SBA6_1350005 [Candidatus Sulfopaludibacter sp. SbA6]|nr:hypothetical protein SBA6_1350005 [Candidatus Sulfopaludibacter sp. SbA6]
MLCSSFAAESGCSQLFDYRPWTGRFRHGARLTRRIAWLVTRPIHPSRLGALTLQKVPKTVAFPGQFLGSLLTLHARAIEIRFFRSQLDCHVHGLLVSGDVQVFERANPRDHIISCSF